jgi:hypothetical protein
MVKSGFEPATFWSLAHDLTNCSIRAKEHKGNRHITVREIRLQINLPFWPDKEIPTAESASTEPCISAYFSLSLFHGHKNMLLTRVCVCVCVYVCVRA